MHYLIDFRLALKSLGEDQGELVGLKEALAVDVYSVGSRASPGLPQGEGWAAETRREEGSSTI